MESTSSSSNWIAGLYPLTKFSAALFLVVVALTAPSFYWKVGLFVSLIGLSTVSGVGQVYIKRLCKSVGVLVVLIVTIQTFFYPGEEVFFSLGIFKATLEGLRFSVNLGLNLMNVAGALVWFFATTTEKDFVLSLEKKGMSAKASYVVLSTLQMVPILKNQAQVIMAAQSARGVETEGNLFTRAKVFLPTLVPLVLSAIQGTEERALTLEARGFSLNRQKSYYYNIHPQPFERALTIGIWLLMVLYLVGRVVFWLWS